MATLQEFLSSLQVDGKTSSSIDLSWLQYDDATEYNIYRSENPGSVKSDYSNVATVSSNTYTDTGLENGKEYYYRVSGNIVQAPSILFDSSDSFQIVEGSPIIDESTNSISNLKTTNSGTDNEVAFNYSSFREDLEFEYTQTSAPPTEFVEDRNYEIIAYRKSGYPEVFTINVVGQNDIHIYKPVDTNQDFGDRRINEVDTGISASGTHNIKINWTGSAWEIDIDNGAFVDTMPLTIEPDSILFGGSGTSDAYLDGTHIFDIQEIV